MGHITPLGKKGADTQRASQSQLRIGRKTGDGMSTSLQEAGGCEVEEIKGSKSGRH